MQHLPHSHSIAATVAHTHPMHVATCSATNPHDVVALTGQATRHISVSSKRQRRSPLPIIRRRMPLRQRSTYARAPCPTGTPRDGAGAGCPAHRAHRDTTSVAGRWQPGHRCSRRLYRFRLVLRFLAAPPARQRLCLSREEGGSASTLAIMLYLHVPSRDSDASAADHVLLPRLPLLTSAYPHVSVKSPIIGVRL